MKARKKIKTIVQLKTELKDVLAKSVNDAASQLPEMPLKWIQNTELIKVPVRARHLLEEYGKILFSEIMSHINQVVSENCTEKLNPSNISVWLAGALKTVR